MVVLAHSHPISLHQLTALDIGPIELAEIAVRLGCDHISLFTYVPERGRGLYPCVEDAHLPALRAILDSTGLSACNLDVFPLDRDGELDRFAEALRLGRALGATRATAQLYDIRDFDHGVRRFAEFCAFAADYGIEPGLEFHAYTDIKDVRSGGEIVRAAGCGSLVIDALHVMRNGAEIGAIAEFADLVGYAQLCDGPLTIDPENAWHEAIRERGLPGTGEFPLREIMAPLARDVVVELEIPQTMARKAGVSAEERARRVVSAARAALDAIDQAG